MKKSRFSEEQIAYALKQVESGTEKVAGVCRKMGVSQAHVLCVAEEVRGDGCC